MHKIRNVKPLQNYKLEIEFDDKKIFVFDVSKYLYGEVFEPLKKDTEFKKVKIDKTLGTIVWETGADFCPDTLYQEMEKLSQCGTNE